MSEVKCEGCGIIYGSPGWCDCTIPDGYWNTVFAEYSVVCFTCMAKRLVEEGIKDVPLCVSSGPFKHDPDLADQSGFERAWIVAGKYVNQFKRRAEQLESLARELAAALQNEIAASQEFASDETHALLARAREMGVAERDSRKFT